MIHCTFFIVGIVPFFLKNRLPSLKPGPGSPTLYYFSGAENDGENIKWAHGVNNLASLKKALESKFLCKNC